jgi:hypothetical protein
MEISSFGGHDDHPANNHFGMDSILYFCRQDLQDKQDFIYFSAFLKKALKANPPNGGKQCYFITRQLKLFWHHKGKHLPGRKIL